MTAPTHEETMEAIYTALHNDNEDIDLHIAALKTSLLATGTREAIFDTARLPVQNRTGRKMMQSYFNKRGITVKFSAEP